MDVEPMTRVEIAIAVFILVFGLYLAAQVIRWIV